MSTELAVQATARNEQALWNRTVRYNAAMKDFTEFVQLVLDRMFERKLKRLVAYRYLEYALQAYDEDIQESRDRYEDDLRQEP